MTKPILPRLNKNTYKYLNRNSSSMKTFLVIIPAHWCTECFHTSVTVSQNWARYANPSHEPECSPLWESSSTPSPYLCRCSFADVKLQRKNFPIPQKLQISIMFMTSHQDNNQELKRFFPEKKKPKQSREQDCSLFCISPYLPVVKMFGCSNLDPFIGFMKVFMKREIVPTRKTRNSSGLPHMI